MNAAQIERTNNHSMEGAQSERLMSLDVLRGFDMFWIIGGAQIFRGLGKLTDRPIAGELLKQLEHVRWEGLHFYDVIWPLFMFIMGAALPFSLAKRRSQGATDRSMILHAVKRGVERAVEHRECSAGRLLDPTRYRVAVLWSPGESAEDKHVERPLQHVHRPPVS